MAVLLGLFLAAMKAIEYLAVTHCACLLEELMTIF